MRFKQVFLLLLLFTFVPAVYAAGEIKISNVTLEEYQAGRYYVHYDIQNVSEDPREVTLRGQVAFFNRQSPKGDLPIAVIKKDKVMVLKPGVVKRLKMQFIGEGTMPRVAMVVKPEVRIRRQRVWNY